MINLLFSILGVLICAVAILALAYPDQITEIWQGYIQHRTYTTLPDVVPDPEPDCADDDFGGKR